MSKPLPPPPIAANTLRRLLAAVADFAAGKPWEYMHDSDAVGLIDPLTRQVRVATVLGRGGEVFAAVMYRHHAGVRWILNMMEGAFAFMQPEAIVNLDAMKVELVTKQEMLKEDLALLKALDFRPAGRGQVWPQFRSSEPGWIPWFINQVEAEQLLADLPRLTAFCTLVRQHSDLHRDRPLAEVPFLPNPMPGRPLRVEDLDWRMLVAAPEPEVLFQTTAAQLAQLGALPRKTRATCAYACSPLPGSPILHEGRPSHSRLSLLVEDQNGLVLGFDMSTATQPFAESAGQGLVHSLLHAGILPGEIAVPAGRLQPILEPLCGALQIKLTASNSLPFLEEAMQATAQMARPG